MSVQYDNIAQQYHDVALGRDDRRYLFVPTVESVLGNVSGLTIADLGCGTGFWTEWLVNQGASFVCGVDESDEMLLIATQSAQRAKLLGSHIEYQKANLAKDFTAITQPVDLVFAAFLLNYASTFDELCEMLRGIRRMMNKGTRFVTLTTNPDHPEFHGIEYDVTFKALNGVFEGCKITVTDYHATLSPVTFEHYWFPKRTYESALRLAGFHSVIWHPLIASQEGLDKFPANHWDRFIDVSNPCVLEAIL